MLDQNQINRKVEMMLSFWNIELVFNICFLIETKIKIDFRFWGRSEFVYRSYRILDVRKEDSRKYFGFG